MRIERDKDRCQVLRPGFPGACCLVELAERCGFRVGQMCHELGCSPSHFRRIFVRDAGVAPKRWLEELRLKGTRESLEAGTATGEVALRMGFSCHASLRRALGRYLPEMQVIQERRGAAGVGGAGKRARIAGGGVPKGTLETFSPGACQQAAGG